ncbi:MAG: glycosyltransferase, partial [Acidobacteriota bacterium]
MACGLPAVATCHGGTAESMQEFGTAFGVLADTSDPAALAGALNQLLLSPDEWEYFHQAGLHRV